MLRKIRKLLSKKLSKRQRNFSESIVQNETEIVKKIKQNKMTNRRKKEIEENLLPLINDSVLNISKTRGKIDQEFTVMGAPYSPHGENHLGIFFNSIIKDIMIRYQILNGKNSKHFVGINCFGEQIEKYSKTFYEENLELEKYSQEIRGSVDPKIEKLDDKVVFENYLRVQVNEHLKDLYRWGVLYDPENVYFTNSMEYINFVYKVLSNVSEEIFLDYIPEFYHLKKKSERISIRDVDIYEDFAVHYFVSYEIDSFQDKKFELVQSLYPGLKFIAYIKEPWTLAGARAVSIHPNSSYTVFVHNKEFYCIQSDCFQQYVPLLFPEGRDPKRLRNFNIQEIYGLKLKDALDPSNKLPLILDESLDRESCPSMIHIYRPAACIKDFNFDSEYIFDKSPIVSKRGKLIHSNKLFQGLSIPQGVADEAILLHLAQENKLFDLKNPNKTIKIKQKGTDNQLHLIPKAEWAIKINHKKLGRMVQEIETSEMKNSDEELPTINLTSVLHNQVDNLRLAGSQKFGIPLPIFQSTKVANSYLINKDVVDNFTYLINQNGLGYWDQAAVEDLLPEKYKAHSGELKKVKGIKLSDSFMNACSALFVKEKKLAKNYPFDLEIEGKDSIQSWMTNSKLVELAINGPIPSAMNLRTHSIIVDDEEKKISKSYDSHKIRDIVDGVEKGSGEKLYGRGVEHLRLWSLSVDQPYSNSELVVTGAEELNSKQAEVNLLRDVIGYFIRFLDGYTNDDFENFEQMLVEEYEGNPGGFKKILLNQISAIEFFVKEAYESSNNSEAYSLIMDFSKQHVLDFIYPYLSNIKGAYGPNTDEYRINLLIAHKTLLVILKCIAPTLPFTAEEASIRIYNQSAFALRFNDHLQMDSEEVKNQFRDFEDIFQMFYYLQFFKAKARANLKGVNNFKDDFVCFFTWSEGHLRIKHLFDSFSQDIAHVFNISEAHWMEEKDFITNDYNLTKGMFLLKVIRHKKLKIHFYQRIRRQLTEEETRAMLEGEALLRE